MNHHDNLDGDIKKLLTLLKKILKNHPQGSDQLSKLLDQKSTDQKSLNLNLCFLTFVPMTPEELMEFEEMYDEYLSQTESSIPSKDDRKPDPRMEFKITAEDADFLKKHGIRFN